MATTSRRISILLSPSDSLPPPPVRYGYDPRTDPLARFTQSVSVRLRIETYRDLIERYTRTV